MDFIEKIKVFLIALVLLLCLACEEKKKVVRTDGWIDNDQGWREVERFYKGDRLYIRMHKDVGSNTVEERFFYHKNGGQQLYIVPKEEKI